MGDRSGNSADDRDRPSVGGGSLPAQAPMQTVDLTDVQKQVATLGVAERFFDSIVLFALFDAGVLKHLSNGPQTLDQLQDKIKGDRESLRAAIDAAVALKVLGKIGNAYSAPEALLECLGREKSPAYIGEWIMFLQALAAPLLQFGEAIRTGSRPGALFEDMSGDTLPARRMTRAMDAYARSRGIEIADRLDFSKAGTLLDLGCGPGTYSLAIVERNPQIHATLLDLEGPIAEAKRIVAARGFTDRVDFIAADAFTYLPAKTYDTVLVSNTLHMIGEDGSRALLEHIYNMVTPGGRLIVQAQYLNDDRTSPRWPTLLNLLQRIATPNGRNHALTETAEWMRAAGFVEVLHVRFAVWNVNSCLIGRRPINGERP